MDKTQKSLTKKSSVNAVQAAFNDEDASISVQSFVTGKVGRKIEFAIITTNVTNDTQVITFTEDGTILYVLTLIYADASLNTLLSVERTA